MLDWPCPRIQHSPPHHHRVNLGNLPGDAGLRLVQDGRARAVDPGLPEVEVEAGRGQGAPQAPSPDHCIPKLVVQIPHVSTRKRSYIGLESLSRKCVTHVRNHIQKKTALSLPFRCLDGFVKKTLCISHQLALYLPPPNSTKLTFF